MIEKDIYKIIFKINKKICKNGLKILGKDVVKDFINKGKMIYQNKKYILQDIIKIQ